jgi:hypothetical protein
LKVVGDHKTGTWNGNANGDAANDGDVAGRIDVPSRALLRHFGFGEDYRTRRQGDEKEAGKLWSDYGRPMATMTMGQ